jgi:D-sedoheptulose 7-phosphate isomerase
MDLQRFYAAQFAEHRAVAEATGAGLAGSFARLTEISVASLKAGGKLMFFGNGGSAADAQHLATELAVRYVGNRAAIAAMALTTDTSALTAIGNDLGFERLFSRQIEALGRPGDVAIGISTSGRSANVKLALRQARDMGLEAVALTGASGGGGRPAVQRRHRI